MIITNISGMNEQKCANICNMYKETAYICAFALMI